MSLRVVDVPPDRPEFIRETIRLVARRLADERARVLARVDAASDADLARGTDEEWGIGQVAVHLLVVERGVIGIALRLAKSEAPGSTGQPRPSASGVTRDGIRTLAEKTAATLERFAREFPAAPDLGATAAHPYFGALNCFGWLLTLPNHVAAHLDALDRGTKSAL